MDKSYLAWRSAMYISGSYPYMIHDDIAQRAHSHNFTYKLGGELDEIFLGDKIEDDF